MKRDQQQKLKVAQILYSGLGGHGSVAFSLLAGDPANCWHNALGFVGIEPLLPAYKKICDERGIPHNYFRVISGKSFLVWPQITAWLYRLRPDVVLLHSVKALLPCLAYSAVFSKPLILVEHQANALKTRPEWLITRLGMLFATRVVYLTENYANEVRTRIGKVYRADKVELIPNGIDIIKFSPAEKSILAGQTVTFGMAARFTNMRRQDILVNTLADLIRLVPDIHWHLSLAGDGATLDSVRNLVVVKGLQHQVTITGHLDETELIDWFKGLDIYVHASEGETLSTSMLQAMACGLPVVASDVPGIRNLLSGDCGFGRLIAHQDSSEFATVLNELVSYPVTTREMGSSARRLVEEKYSHKIMAARYSELIERARNR